MLLRRRFRLRWPSWARLLHEGCLRQRSLLFIVVYNLALALGLQSGAGGPALRTALSDIGQWLGPFVMLMLVLPALPDVPRRRSFWAAVCLALVVLCFLLGQSMWIYYEVVIGAPMPYPSLADLFFVLEYPSALAGILLLPAPRLSPVLRTRHLLDGLMLMLGAATLSWYFVLGPLVFAERVSRLETAVSLAYPCGDLLLVGCLVLLLRHLRGGGGLRAGVPVALGYGVLVLTDTAFTLLEFNDTYVTGTLLDVGWPLSYMLIALGARRVASYRVPAVADQAPEKLCEAAPEALFWMILPFGALLGVVGLGLYTWRVQGDAELEPGVYSGGVLVLLVMLARQLFAILENQRLYARLQQAYAALEQSHAEVQAANQRLEALATVDPLTGLANHRAIVWQLDSELERARRWQQPFALLFLDLDHFKALNDSGGHALGDDTLREFGAVARASLRSFDVLGRWGGEEFVALLPQTGLDDALRLAEGLRAAVAAHRFTEAGIHLTCSIGLALYPDDGLERDTLLERADRAMYAAKRLGRNQVRCASDPVVDALDATRLDSREEIALQSTVEALAELVAARDRYSGEHASRVAAFAVELARLLGVSAAEQRLVVLGARLHNIGKITLPDRILHHPEALSPDEWELMRQHPIIGAEIVSRVPSLRVLAPLIRHHHERWDGLGYPDGLAGEAIPLLARIIAVADAYAAMTSERPYRRARQPHEALRELQRCAGTQFDPAVVAAMHQLAARAMPASDDALRVVAPPS
ncbi:bifunctional diguanylate cyclase/phosphohydrolase [Kallotenue papyrolyticum]|uniref:bifunctional diguanylate cyclase/phosphohydrolase n=1 Tax=Kallotenue papyrolyticum TaxID=1325125 RepID=UPI0004929FF7|nr:diguanylate cyclase [Kallotenue papyrolyticum]